MAEFLVGTILPDAEPSTLNLRTLHLGYELRAQNPEDWRELLAALTLARTFDGSPDELVRELSASPSSVAEQESAFCRATGLSRRSFFHCRRRLGLSRPYSLVAGVDETLTTGLEEH